MDTVAEDFDALVAAADDAVWIVTTVAGGHHSGCLVGFAGQVSIEPRRFLVALSKQNHTFRTAMAARYLAVHLLRPDDRELARLFAGTTGDEVDKFARCRWETGPHGLAVLSDAAGWFAARIVDRHDLGDHSGVVTEPVAAGTPPSAGFVPLRYDAVADIPPGHEN
ncbi:flavin reductase family protein [Nocardia thailandica]|uniref:Flavin reductase family protein n=1 Tax=Nocardia thailandica TaxID=257275 RepID=A0ABW6PTN3_9NOCA